ncbi:MAG: histidine kinase [Acidobacteriota bacterium]|nr:histidine kinase [Acidobacteriota bacterium]
MMQTLSSSDTHPGGGRGRGAVLAALLGLWGLFGFLSASQIYLGSRAEGMDHSFWRMLAWQWLGWCFWGLLTPPILWLKDRVPFERASWWRALPVHLAACVLLSALHLAFFTFVTVQIRPFDVMTVERTFAQLYVGRLRSQLHIDLLIYGIILGVGHAAGYYERFRERERRAAQLEAQLAQAQLQALKMQLHPHFLFNTLNGVAGLVRDHKNKEAVTMLAGLSDLLRHTLDSAGKQEVPLREELDFLELYLDIQQMRFPDRLRVEMRVAPDTLDAMVPNLILQPLVENAVRHGVAARAASGTVGVAAEREDGLLWVTVYDDGPGLKDGRQVLTEGGIGLTNTRARLAQLYGARHRFSVRNREGGGVEAVVAIPFRRAEEGELG